MVCSKWWVGWELKAVVQVHGSLTQSDVDCFCSSPLPVSTHTSLHFGTVPVGGMLGLVGVNCYAIPRVPSVSLPVCVCT